MMLVSPGGAGHADRPVSHAPLGGAMSYAEQMLRTSPGNPPVDEAALAVLAECIESCFDCAQTCTACADACMAEKNFQELMRCIRLNLHCADLCATTGRIL